MFERPCKLKRSYHKRHRRHAKQHRRRWELKEHQGTAGGLRSEKAKSGVGAHLNAGRGIRGVHHEEVAHELSYIKKERIRLRETLRKEIYRKNGMAQSKTL